MPTPILLFNYALSQSHAAASRSRHSDRLLPLLLILSSSTSFEQWQHGNSVTNDTLPLEHLVAEEFKHHLVRLKTTLSKPNPLHHFPTIEPCRTIDIQHIVACNSNQACWGLSQTQAHEWHVAPSGVVLGLFDTGMQLRRALLRSLLSPTTVVATTTASNDHGLAIKDMQKHVAVVADLFAQWSSTQEARNAARHCRHALEECGAVLHRTARHKQWLRQCATFREMQVFASKEEGTQALQPGDWFVGGQATTCTECPHCWTIQRSEWGRRKHTKKDGGDPMVVVVVAVAVATVVAVAVATTGAMVLLLRLIVMPFMQ